MGKKNNKKTKNEEMKKNPFENSRSQEIKTQKSWRFSWGNDCNEVVLFLFLILHMFYTREIERENIRTVTGASTLWTLLSSTRISMALRQRAFTSDSLRGSHRFSCSICLSRSDDISLSLSPLSVSLNVRGAKHARSTQHCSFCLSSEINPPGWTPAKEGMGSRTLVLSRV